MLTLPNSLAQFGICYFILHVHITFHLVLIESLAVLSWFKTGPTLIAKLFFFFFNRNCANENRCDSFKAAPTLGRPKDNFNVWVIGEVQVNNLGEVVPEDAREYVYVQELTASRIKPPEVVLPFKKEALNGVFSSLKDTIHHNYMGGLVAVGKN